MSNPPTDIVVVDPDNPAAFERLVGELTERGAFVDLARAYRKMLGALLTAEKMNPEQRAAWELRLWRELAELYREQLGDLSSAAEAFEAVTRLAPRDASSWAAIATMHEDSGRVDEAISAHREAFLAFPASHDALQALLDLYLQRGTFDAAWRVASVLNRHGALHADGRDFLEDHRPRQVGCSRWELTSWSPALLHPSMDPDLTEILRLALPPSSAAKSATAPEALAWAELTLGVSTDFRSGLDPRRRLDERLEDGRTLKEHLFAAGREVVLRRFHAPRPAADVVVAMWAALQVVHPERPVPERWRVAAESAASELRQRLDPAAKAQLVARVAKLSKVTLGDWQRGVIHTANRAGLLLTSDIDLAVCALTATVSPTDLPSLRDQVADLEAYFVAEEYPRLRGDFSELPLGGINHRTRANARDLERCVQEVIARPNDDDARLAFADAVETDDPLRATFVRLDIEDRSAGRCGHDPPGGEFFRVHQLFCRHGERWSADVRPLVDRLQFSGGFVELIAVDAARFLQTASSIYDRAPVLRLWLTGVKPVAQQLFSSPFLERIRALELARNDLDDDDVELIARSAHLGELRWLSLSTNRVGPRGLEALAASQGLPRLEYLGLSFNPVADPTPKSADTYDTDSAMATELMAKYGHRAWLSASGHRYDWPPGITTV